jgi:hypothetical protein
VCFTNAGGSVVQLLDRSDGSIDATYVYDVNGDTVSKSGTYADDNPLRYYAMYFDKELDYADTACDGLYCTPTGNYYSPRLGRAVTRGGGRVPAGFAGNVGGALPYGGGQFHMPLIGGGDVYVSPGCADGGCDEIQPQDPCANPQTAEDCERCNPPCPEGFEYAIVNGECVCTQASISPEFDACIIDVDDIKEAIICYLLYRNCMTGCENQFMRCSVRGLLDCQQRYPDDPEGLRECLDSVSQACHAQKDACEIACYALLIACLTVAVAT